LSLSPGFCHFSANVFRFGKIELSYVSVLVKKSCLLHRYGKGFGFSINRFVNGVASAFSTEWELEEVMLSSFTNTQLVS
jgi:hypothetical protein